MKRLILALGSVTSFACVGGVLYVFAVGMMNGLFGDGYEVTIQMNAIGEFWPEFVFLVVGGVCAVSMCRYIVEKYVFRKDRDTKANVS